MKKLIDSTARVTRAELADPHAGKAFLTRLQKHANAIDLRDNHVVVHGADGYVEFRPTDKSKRFK